MILFNANLRLLYSCLNLFEKEPGSFIAPIHMYMRTFLHYDLHLICVDILRTSRCENQLNALDGAQNPTE